MMSEESVLAYEKMMQKLGSGRRHILLGNGFSIACDPIFSYPRLYDTAVKADLSARAQEVFGRLGTNNFEGVMRLLDDSHWVSKIYGLIDGDASEMLADVEVVKRTLVRAVATSHLENTGAVSGTKKDCALYFLRSFHNIFTTNYDLLPYWVTMHAGENPVWKDGFRPDPDDPTTPHLVFSERLGSQKGLFFIHGALHLYVEGGELRKHSWIRGKKPLTQLIREGLAARQYPLFVAEGSPNTKLEQIQRNGYLWYCLDKLARIEVPLVVFGHSLGPSDQHIADVIAENPKLPLLAIGLHGDPDSSGNQAIYATASNMQARRDQLRKKLSKVEPLDVIYYQSETACAWG